MSEWKGVGYCRWTQGAEKETGDGMLIFSEVRDYGQVGLVCHSDGLHCARDLCGSLQ